MTKREKGNIQKLVSALVKKGYIERVAGAGGQEGIRLTAKGKAVVQAGELNLAGLDAFVLDDEGSLARVKIEGKPNDN